MNTTDYKYVKAIPGKYQCCFKSTLPNSLHPHICYNAYDMKWYSCSFDWEQSHEITTHGTVQMLGMIPDADKQAIADEALGYNRPEKPSTPFKDIVDSNVVQINIELNEAENAVRALRNEQQMWHKLQQVVTVYSLQKGIAPNAIVTEVFLNHMRPIFPGLIGWYENQLREDE